MKEMAMKRAAMDLLGKLSSVDVSKARSIDIRIDMGEPSGKHMMPDGEMMDDDEMSVDSQEDSSAMRCPDCGDKIEDGMCKSCGYKVKMNPDKDVESPEEYKKDTAKVRKQEYGM
jgi:DNA-directed RNA polymerase subunit RPC12/RpoP